MAGPYFEILDDASKITVKPVVTATVTEDIWRERAGEGWFVKSDADGVTGRGGGLHPVEFLALGDDHDQILGRLEVVNGSGTDFVATIVIRAYDGNAIGGGTAGELTDAMLGSGVEADATGKLILDTTGNSFGRIIGGRVEMLRLAWDGIDNFK